MKFFIFIIIVIFLPLYSKICNSQSIIDEAIKIIQIESKVTYGTIAKKNIFFNNADYFNYMNIPEMYVPTINMSDINKIREERFSAIFTKSNNIINTNKIDISERTNYYIITNSGINKYAGKNIFIFFIYPEDPISGYGYWITINSINNILNITKRIRISKRNYNTVSEYVETTDYYYNKLGILLKKEITKEDFDYIKLSIHEKRYIYNSKGILIDSRDNKGDGIVDFEREEWERFDRNEKPYDNCWWWDYRLKKIKKR